MAKFNGDDVLIYCDGVAIAHSIDGTITFNEETPDSTTKDSNRWKEHIHGDRGWEVSVNGLMDINGDRNAVQLLNYIMSSNDVTIRVANIASGSPVSSGDMVISGTVTVSNESLNFPHNAPAAFDATFIGNGLPTFEYLT